jgi:hypothetical protein
MNEDYLWSKKGRDPEIQGLENLLSEYRFAAGTPPELPATNVIQLAEVRKRRFAWSFAFAASVAVAMVVAWFVRPEPALTSDRKTRQESPEITFVQPAVEPATTIKFPDSEKQAVPDVHRPSPIQPKAKPILRREPKATLTASAQKLTREEKYAYDRLMLALSIAGSKLKIVQDTIDRTGETNQRNIRNDK